VDETGLSGRYDFTLEYALESAGSGRSEGGEPVQSPDGLPSIFTTLQEQVGLKLESQKEAVLNFWQSITPRSHQEILPRRVNLWMMASVSEPSRRGTGGTSCRWNRMISVDLHRRDRGVGLHRWTLTDLDIKGKTMWANLFYTSPDWIETLVRITLAGCGKTKSGELEYCFKWFL
jgi:Protein of unknown function (DUF3738)